MSIHAVRLSNYLICLSSLVCSSFQFSVVTSCCEHRRRIMWPIKASLSLTYSIDQTHRLNSFLYYLYICLFRCPITQNTLLPNHISKASIFYGSAKFLYWTRPDGYVLHNTAGLFVSWPLTHFCLWIYFSSFEILLFPSQSWIYFWVTSAVSYDWRAQIFKRMLMLQLNSSHQNDALLSRLLTKGIEFPCKV